MLTREEVQAMGLDRETEQAVLDLMTRVEALESAPAAWPEYLTEQDLLNEEFLVKMNQSTEAGKLSLVQSMRAHLATLQPIME